MVDILVIFQSLATYAASKDDNAKQATREEQGSSVDNSKWTDRAVDSSVAATDGDAQGACNSLKSYVEELHLSYQSGLDLLLNAADLELNVAALLDLKSVTGSKLEQFMGESLVKRFKQLDLYDIEAFYVGSISDASTALASDDKSFESLDFIKAIDEKEAVELKSRAKKIIYV